MTKPKPIPLAPEYKTALTIAGHQAYAMAITTLERQMAVTQDGVEYIERSSPSSLVREAAHRLVVSLEESVRLADDLAHELRAYETGAL